MVEAAALASAIALAAVWIGYPAAIALLAAIARTRRPRRSGGDLDPSPTVSIVLATRDDARAVRARVEDCLRADYDAARLQVVVALDARARGQAADLDDIGAGDQVMIVAGDLPGGKAAALNAGVRAATGQVLVFADAHQRFEVDAVRHLVSALRVPGVGVASGSLTIPTRPGEGARLAGYYWRFERWLRRCEARVRSCVGVTGSIYAMRRELWTALPVDLLLDDVYVPMKAVLAGWRIGFAERAGAVETRRHTSLDEFRRKVRTLTGVVQLCVRLPAVLLPFRNPIWPQFVFHKLLRLLTPYWVLVVLLWAVVGTIRWTGAYLPVAVGMAAVVGVCAARTRKSWGQRVRRLVSEAVLLNAAVVMAGYNGLRGRWHVWNQ